MSEPKKQHYVPQTYLKNFATGKKNKSIYVRSISPQKIYLSQIENVAAERHFYTVDFLPDKYLWENTYARDVEPEFGKLLKSIRKKCENVLVQNKSVVISKEEKYELVIHIVIQLLRGKIARMYQKRIYDKNLPSVFEKSKEIFPSLSQETYNSSFKKFTDDEDYFKGIIMQTNFNENNLIKIANCLFEYSFVFNRVSGNAELITSDNPVMFMNSITHNVRPFSNGLVNNTTIMYFALSPKLLVEAYNPRFFGGHLNKKDCSVEFLDAIKEQVFINTYNKKQLVQCSNCVYAHSEEVLNNL